MAWNVWEGGTAAVAQVDKFTPANVEVDDIFTLTITGEDGTTAAVSFTATAATVNNVTTGLAAAWNASTDPLATALTASDQTTYMDLTADTAGIPFNVASSTTEGGGSDVQTLTRAAVTATKGPNDYAVAENWSLGAIPVGTNQVLIPAGTPAILYSLPEANDVQLADFVVEAGYTNAIGSARSFLQLDLSASFKFSGTGTAYIDLTTSAIAPEVYATATATSGSFGLHLKGTALTTLAVYGGKVAFGTAEDDITSECNNFIVGKHGANASNAELTLGPNVKNTSTADITTVIVNGGRCICWAPCATVTVLGGEFSLKGTATIDTNLYVVSGVFYYDSSGTLTQGYVQSAGNLSNTRDGRAKTITNLTMYGGSLNDPNSKITHSNDIQFPAGLDNVSLNLGKGSGKGIKFTPAAI